MLLGAIESPIDEYRRVRHCEEQRFEYDEPRREEARVLAEDDDTLGAAQANQRFALVL